MSATPRICWIGVASRDHVRNGVACGFCQLGHGKHAPVLRLKPHDRIAYYSPRETMDAGEPVRAFTAIGEIADREAYPVEMTADFSAWRRDVDWWPAEEAAIEPLIGDLDFITDKAHWGYPFRRGALSISERDFGIIARAMRAEGRL